MLEPEIVPATTHEGFTVGDTVRVGHGQRFWVIESFWGFEDRLARLKPVDGYSHTSVHVRSLVLVEKAGA